MPYVHSRIAAVAFFLCLYCLTEPSFRNVGFPYGRSICEPVRKWILTRVTVSANAVIWIELPTIRSEGILSLISQLNRYQVRQDLTSGLETSISPYGGWQRFKGYLQRTVDARRIRRRTETCRHDSDEWHCRIRNSEGDIGRCRLDCYKFLVRKSELADLSAGVGYTNVLWRPNYAYKFCERSLNLSRDAHLPKRWLVPLFTPSLNSVCIGRWHSL